MQARVYRVKYRFENKNKMSATGAMIGDTATHHYVSQIVCMCSHQKRSMNIETV